MLCAVMILDREGRGGNAEQGLGGVGGLRIILLDE